jgi:hypothetical protein
LAPSAPLSNAIAAVFDKPHQCCFLRFGHAANLKAEIIASTSSRSRNIQIMLPPAFHRAAQP